MFKIESKPRERMLEVTRKFQRKDVAYSFSNSELLALRPFFTNVNKTTFFVHSLPSTVGTALLAMFSRMKNPRGVRGSWTDSFLPTILVSKTAEVIRRYEEDEREGRPEERHEEKYLKENGIKTLDEFINHSEECREFFEEFLAKSCGDPKYIEGIADSKRAKRFLRIWLDKYGHNSIARMGSMWLCCERVSLLAAKSIEWPRPGTGYIELSTRYVDMGGKDVYPIAEMLEAGYGYPASIVNNLFTGLFNDYQSLFGDKGDGILPSFFHDHYGQLFEEADRMGDLKMGVSGETSDVLGNLLPLATLTEVAIACSGEALPSILKHLLLDGTPENEVIIEAILEEAPKVGADNYVRHWRPSSAEEKAWRYQSDRAEIWDMAHKHGGVFPIHSRDIYTGNVRTSIAQKKAGEDSLKSGDHNIADYLQDIFGENGKNRVYHDKLPREFELASVSFCGVMTMRGWRDLHRQSLNTHLRTLVGPNIGFYEYDKPHPRKLKIAFTDAATLSTGAYESLENVPEFLRQYIMPMGWKVGFVYSGNLRQLEFSLWQRTKPSANHEVRQVFLSMEHYLVRELPWWRDASRATTLETHREQKYIFARSKSETGLPLRESRPA